MAKKKGTQKNNDTKEENPQDQKNQNPTKDKTITHQHSMEAEKLQNLKNLNSMLLKETLEKRQLVESLVHDKETLEAELSRFGVEKSELVAELTRESEKSVSLEIERNLFCVFVVTQMREMGIGLEKEKIKRDNEIKAYKSEVSVLMDSLENERDKSSHACRERDLIKTDLDSQVKEATRLKERLIQMEGKERDLKNEILVLKNESERLAEVKNVRESDIEALKKEKSLLERKSVQMIKEIDYLKLEIEVVLRGKREIEMETSKQKLKIDEFEKEVGNLNMIVSDLQMEEKVLREKIFELEKSYSEAVSKKEEMTLEINALICQEREKQKNVDKLMEEKEKIFKMHEMALVDLNDKKGEIEKLLGEKNDIEDRKVSQESEIIGLHKEIGELRDVVFTLKKSCGDQEEKNKQLLNQARDYKNALDRALLERDNAHKGLDVEKKNGMDLRSIVSEMQQRIDENAQELAKISSERDVLFEERKTMESHIGLLMEEKKLTQKGLLEAKQNADELRAKVESIGSHSSRALSMLKRTAAMVCQSKNDSDGQEVLVNEKKLQDENEQYVAELEAIKNAFGIKKKLVEDMKQQVEVMQKSAAEAHKKKSLWTVVSSATTIFAAASMAYAAKVR